MGGYYPKKLIIERARQAQKDLPYKKWEYMFEHGEWDDLGTLPKSIVEYLEVLDPISVLLALGESVE